jgi:hypothetical protein
MQETPSPTSGLLSDPDASRWVSYPELASARGIGRASAERLTRKHKWPRQTMNDGTVRVCVPPDWLRPSETDRRSDHREDHPQPAAVRTDAVAAFQEALRLLSQQLTNERDRQAQADARATAATIRADQAEARADAAEADAREAQAQAQVARARAEKAEQDNAAAVVIADEAVGAAEVLRQANADRKARGRWARLRAAWRGE